MGEERNACSVFVGKPEGKRPIGRTRLNWEYNIKMVLKEILRTCTDWIHLALEKDQWGEGLL
jgi:hypothetical protein